MEEYGPKKWSLIASKLKTKGSKQASIYLCYLCVFARNVMLSLHVLTMQCRRRWKNYLNADLKTGGWTPEVGIISNLAPAHRFILTCHASCQ